MIRLMIVDDELVIRKGLETSVDWASLGIEIVAQASNGRDGLSRALVMQPDIILSDVKMPVMDGITMVQEVRKKLPNVHVVMLSGYSDFQFTRQAFKAGAVDYLLKPVSVEVLTELMGKLQGKIYEERENRRQRQNRGQIIHQALPVLRGELFLKYARGEITQEEFWSRGMAKLGFLLGGPFYQTVILEYDAYHQMIKGKEDSGLMQYTLSNIAGEILGTLGQVTVCYLSESRILAVISTEEESSLYQVAEYCREVQFYVMRYFGQTVTAGIGACGDGEKILKESFAQAEEAVKSKVIRGKNQIVTYEDVGEREDDRFLVLPAEMEKNLREQIRLQKEMEVQKQLDQIFIQCLKGRTDRKEIQRFCILLVSILFQELESGKTEGEILRDGNLFEEIERCEIFFEMRMWVKHIYSQMFQRLEQSQSSQYHGIVKKTMEYAMEHYAEKLKATDMAALAFVTPNYFSRIFKQETGENFTEWLNKYRIEKAKELMSRESEDKSYEIAMKVGFQDYKYFTYIFKKYTGYSPVNYRNLSRT